LAYLSHPDALVRAAFDFSALTHHDAEAGEACALWCLAVRYAVLYGALNIRAGLARLPEGRVRVWAARLDEAERSGPADFPHNGWVVHAVQGAWSAITTTARISADPGSSSPSSDYSTRGPAHLRRALEAAVRGGYGTDTVAAIAGALVGGLYGASAIPAQWRRQLHGWPGLRARDLVALGVMTARGGHCDAAGWPAGARVDYSKYKDRALLARHPDDAGVWLGGVDALDNLPDGVDAVVSLCRLGASQVPAPGVAASDHIEVWLSDDPGPNTNSNLGFVLADVADAIAVLRGEGRTVLVHCVKAQSRTPAVAAVYGARVTGHTLAEALADIRAVLPHTNLNSSLRAALKRSAHPLP
jgi:ADP-ribosyl-[dinitrogen reductase] hydrolase